MTVRYSDRAKKELRKLDNSVKSKILDYMDRVAELPDPKSKGKMLVGNLLGFWRYRVGDYRIICRIQNKELLIVVVEIGHRREVYD